jgi:hypothetical protein
VSSFASSETRQIPAREAGAGTARDEGHVVRGGEADDPGDLDRRRRKCDGEREGRLQVGRLVAPMRLTVRGAGGEPEIRDSRGEDLEERGGHSTSGA